MSAGGRARPGSSSSGAGAGVFLAVVGAIVGAGSLLVWIAGAIAGIAAGGEPVLVGLGDAGTVLAELPGHLDDPAGAWPAAVRDELPDRTTMVAALLVALGLLVALAAAALWLLGRVRGDAGKGRRSARWASARDLRRLRVKGPERGRVILGRYQRQLVASEPRTSVLVVAPTQSGKTTSLVVPTLLEWDGPVLATSIKADLVQDTLAARSGRGEAKLFDPTGSTGLPTAAWSPIGSSTSWSAARRTAAGILLIREKDAFGASVDDRHWKPAAARLLAPVLLAHELLGLGAVRGGDAHPHAHVGEPGLDELGAVLEAALGLAGGCALASRASPGSSRCAATRRARRRSRGGGGSRGYGPWGAGRGGRRRPWSGRATSRARPRWCRGTP